jgi:tetratricopeptide (TPR) repeat protein
MGNFFKSLFSPSTTESADDIQAKAVQKNFDIFKYDGIRAQRMGQVSYAIKCYIEALKIKDDTEVMGMLINAYSSIHETEEALQVAHRLVAFEPENKNVLLTRATLFHLLAREEEALADCLRLVEPETTSPAPWLLLARIKKTMNDLPGAVAGLTQAISLQEDWVDAYLLRAEVFLEENKMEEALQDVEKLLTLAPEEETAYLLRGRIHEKAGRLDEAMDNYTQVIELNPFNEEAILLRSRLLLAGGKYDEAIVSLDEAIEIKPDFAAAYSLRAEAKRQNGDTTGADEDEQKAAELRPESDTEEEKPATNFNNMYKGGIF